MSLQYEKTDDNNEVNIIVPSKKTHEVNDFTKQPDISHYKKQDDHHEVYHSVFTRNTTLGVEKKVYNSNQKMTNTVEILKLKKTYQNVSDIKLSLKNTILGLTKP